mmetsp:Transcript_51063/g.163374  ORF Transcript_51063/g.163374 Transcript_51063/m.163374 type:complete len:207 (-) Transcript_51063:99-719(-)
MERYSERAASHSARRFSKAALAEWIGLMSSQRKLSRRAHMSSSTFLLSSALRFPIPRSTSTTGWSSGTPRLALMGPLKSSSSESGSPMASSASAISASGERPAHSGWSPRTRPEISGAPRPSPSCSRPFWRPSFSSWRGSRNDAYTSALLRRRLERSAHQVDSARADPSCCSNAGVSSKGRKPTPGAITACCTARLRWQEQRFRRV